MFIVNKLKKIRAFRASTTIEAAVIVPLFVIMVVQFIFVAEHCHDQTIYNAVAVKGNVVSEFGARKEDDYKKNMEDVNGKINVYLDEKTIGSGRSITIKSSILNIESDASVIAKNDPVEFTWLSDAATKLVKGV